MLRIPITLCLLLTLSVSQAQACECKAPRPQKAAKAYNDADIIVNGKIDTVSGGFHELGPMVRIKINKVIKGNDNPEMITANYNPNTYVCGHEFKKGEEHTLALYDTRGLGVTDRNTRGYGYRVMIACDQKLVKHHMKQMNLDLDTKKENK